MDTELKAEQLRRPYASDALMFETTAELPVGTSIIGQQRGVQAIEFGLNMTSIGYNIFVLGEAGTGRTTAIQRFVEKRAVDDPPPYDWVYVHNFKDPQRPVAIRLPAGGGCTFRDTMKRFVNRLQQDVANAFDNQLFRDAMLEVHHNLDAQREATMAALQAKAQQIEAAILPSPEGFKIVPANQGQPLDPQQLAAWTDDQQATWKETFHQLQHELNEAAHQLRKLEAAAQDGLDTLKRRVAKSVIDDSIDTLKNSYDDNSKIQTYLDQVYSDILDHVDLFRSDDEGGESGMNLKPLLRQYDINVLVDHAESHHAPVLVEFDPTLPRLLGRVDHEARHGGAIITNFTMIRAGALHAANGGYLVLRARDLFNEEDAWDALKRVLIGQSIRPDDPASRGGAAARTLDPEPIPLNLKVVLIGPPELYYHLFSRDEDFRTIFKVMADFDQRVERTPENEADYATFIASRVQEEELRHLSRAAVGRVIEYGSRLAATQHKLSTRFGHIADLVREANHWAGVAGEDIVTEAHVEAAIDHRHFLRGRVENLFRENLREGKQLVSITGTAVGQVNGLSVSQVGDHAFGHPSRVTARTYVGESGVVQIDREVELAGRVHNKGVMTLIGYLGGRFATDHPLALAAQISFEQNYGGIDGDSASSTELYALISSLSGIPLSQEIAVTGSVNQEGEVQAIGGVTEKVEGWFAVCEAQGLTGTQGVLIPAANVSDLMLRVSIVEAVRAGKFHVWAIDHIDQGLERLTGIPAEEVHAAAAEKLHNLGSALAVFEASGLPNPTGSNGRGATKEPIA